MCLFFIEKKTAGCARGGPPSDFTTRLKQSELPIRKSNIRLKPTIEAVAVYGRRGKEREETCAQPALRYPPVSDLAGLSKAPGLAERP